MTGPDRQIEQIDQQLAALSAALLAGAPEPLLTQGTALHQVLLSIDRLQATRLSTIQRKRLATCADRLRLIRDNLSRRAAGVERELNVLLPQAKPVTYGAGGGLRGRGGY